MRSIGRSLPKVTARPRADNLRAAVLQENVASAMAVIQSTGIPKGIYRFRTHQEADAQRLNGLVRVIAANAARQRRRA